MNTRLRRVVTVLSTVLLTAAGTAVVRTPASAVQPIYVDQAGGGVDDAGCGTGSAHACASIGQGIANAVAGQTVIVAAATYRENITIDKAITLQGEAATIDGTVSVGAVAGAVTVEGFTVSSDSATPLISEADTDPSADVTISDNSITGTSASSQTGIAVSPTTGGVSITGNTFTLGSGGGAAISLSAPDPADTLNVTTGGNTGTVTAPTRTIDESGAGTITVTPTDTPNTIMPSGATLHMHYPANVFSGKDAEPFDGTVNGGVDLPHARYDVTITGTSGITASQLDLTGTQGNSFTLSGAATAGNAITGYLEPAAGFDLPPGQNNITFRLSAVHGAPDGSLSVATTLDEVAPPAGSPVVNTVASASGTVFIVANHAPVANSPGPVAVPFNGSAPITLTATDADNDPLTYTVATHPAHGQLTGTAPNLTYTPDTSYTGTDSFTFTASDGIDTSNTATVSLIVAANKPPVATDRSYSVTVGGTVAITLAATDPEGGAISFTHTNPDKGTVTGSSASLTYHAPATSTGDAHFSYTATDNRGAIDTATITIHIAKARAAIGSVTFSPAHPTSAQVPKVTVAVAAPAGSVAGGTVTVTYGSAKRTAKVGGGRATVSLSKFTGGAHKFSIAFAGTATTSTATATKSLTVSKVHTTLTVSTSPKQLTTKSKGTLKVRVKATGASINGKTAMLMSGSRVIGTAKVVHRVAAITLPKLSLGQHNWSIYYPGSTTATPATQSVILRVALG